MADINVERKGPSIWPWVIGLLVLALLIWAIAEMVDTEEEVPEVAEVEQVEEQPAAVPEPEPVEPTPGVMDAPDFELADAEDLENLTPLGAGDIGQPVRIEGEVVGTPTAEGFWVRTDDDEVIFVAAPAWTQDEEQLASTELEEGREVELAGVIQRLSADRSNRAMEEAGLRDAEGFQDWNVHSDFMIGNRSATDTPGKQDQAAPGAQRTTPGGDGAEQRR